MSSIQERLQLKRVPLDTWNVREQLCLASAVVRSGDQNWMSVSRALKTVGDPNRPSDWYSQKSCAAQYGTLLEHVETPKRKKRNSEGLGETPQESILKRLTQDRITEIQKTIADMNKQYETLKTEITEIRNPATSDERIQTMWSEVEASISAKERDSATRAAWLREREERRARAERTWRPQHQPLPPTSAPPSSPLLTSLLKSSPVVTTPQHISHPANVVDSISPSAGAPTLSMLLEKCAPPACAASPAPPLHDNKHAAIEHIKSQLVQIEHQLKASSSAGATPVLAPPPPPLDIDDIEIKAEDVYAFRDVDIEIPPVAAMHKPPPARVADRPAMPKKEEMLETVTETMPTDQIMQDDEKMQDVVLEESTDEISNVETSTEEPVPEPAPPSPKVMENPVEVKISLLEVKFPTPEIKIRQPEEKVIKEEIKEPTSQTRPEVLQSPQEAEVTLPAVEKTINIPEEPQEPEVTAPSVEETPTESVAEAKADVEPESEEVSEETVDVPDPPGESIDSPADAAPAASESAPPLPPPHSPEDTIEQQLERMQGPDGDDDRPLHEIKEQEEQEDSKPLKDMISETRQDKHDAAFKQEKETEDTHTETDDDTPMELSREEEKDGKKRRDYSRKKKPDSRTCSGSESAAETSAPDSPTTCDAERQHRLWKKSLMLVYSRLSAHKYASLFQRPITDEQAPGYSVVVKRPMDLSTIKRNIDTGVVRTTAEFQRDVLLMLTNALMYNSSEHTVYEMAKEMFNEAETQLGMLLAAQAHAELGAAPEEAGGAPSRRRRLAEKRRHEQT